MSEAIGVVLKKDDSVDRVIQRKARELEKKYNQKRKVNEKLLRRKTPVGVVFAVLFDILCVVMLLGSSLLCFASINSSIQHVCPTFAGYANLVIVSPSMVKSGFNVGDSVIVRAVDTHTLKEDDIIAFYGYSKDFQKFNINGCIRITEKSETQYIFKPSSLLGFQSDQIKEAAAAGASLYFHHIRTIYEDENGVRWFNTYGSSNEVNDPWVISEYMIVGIYDDSESGQVIRTVISAVSSRWGILILLAPIFLIAAVIVIECIRDVQLAFLELDCIEEKRKVTDPICVKNDVGFNMDLKTKYKVLAQATPEDASAYISVLWREGTTPVNIKKYFLKKNLLYSYNKKMLELNRICEQMYKDGASAMKVARYYTNEKAKLEQEQRMKAKQLRSATKEIELNENNSSEKIKKEKVTNEVKKEQVKMVKVKTPKPVKIRAKKVKRDKDLIESKTLKKHKNKTDN